MPAKALGARAFARLMMGSGACFLTYSSSDDYSMNDIRTVPLDGDW